MRGSSLRFLLEAMQYIDRILLFGDVDHPKRTGFILKPDFLYTSPDGFYRFPVIGFLAMLNLIDLIARFTAHREGGSRAGRLPKGYKNLFEVMRCQEIQPV